MHIRSYKANIDRNNKLKSMSQCKPRFGLLIIIDVNIKE